MGERFQRRKMEIVWLCLRVRLCVCLCVCLCVVRVRVLAPTVPARLCPTPHGSSPEVAKLVTASELTLAWDSEPRHGVPLRHPQSYDSLHS